MLGNGIYDLIITIFSKKQKALIFPQYEKRNLASWYRSQLNPKIWSVWCTCRIHFIKNSSITSLRNNRERRPFVNITVEQVVCIVALLELRKRGNKNNNITKVNTEKLLVKKCWVITFLDKLTRLDSPQFIIVEPNRQHFVFLIESNQIPHYVLHVRLDC